MGALFTAALTIGIGVAYTLLATVRFNIAAAAILRFSYRLGVPDVHRPWWVPQFVIDRWTESFRWSARLFFAGCAYTHFEIGAHAIVGDLPVDYYEFVHQTSMFLQGIGAWWFVGVLSAVEEGATRRQVSG